mmetsp:Transcript_94202/g.299039  ORF Transcript_94202/g.299039 Transcript_94202/m.299039 type:complete len:232 (-) Transcript_94202:863-1558(-)
MAHEAAPRHVYRRIQRLPLADALYLRKKDPVVLVVAVAIGHHLLRGNPPQRTGVLLLGWLLLPPTHQIGQRVVQTPGACAGQHREPLPGLQRAQALEQEVRLLELTAPGVRGVAWEPEVPVARLQEHAEAFQGAAPGAHAAVHAAGDHRVWLVCDAHADDGVLVARHLVQDPHFCTLGGDCRRYGRSPAASRVSHAEAVRDRAADGGPHQRRRTMAPIRIRVNSREEGVHA